MSKSMTLRDYIQVEWVTNYGKVLNIVSPWTAAHLIVEAIESLGYIISNSYDPKAKHRGCGKTFNDALKECPSLNCYTTVDGMYGEFRSAFAHSGCSGITLNNTDTENLVTPNYTVSAKLLYKRFVDACDYVCTKYSERVDVPLLSIG